MLITRQRQVPACRIDQPHHALATTADAPAERPHPPALPASVALSTDDAAACGHRFTPVHHRSPGKAGMPGSPILRELPILASARVCRQQLADTWAQPARRVRCEGRRFDAEAGTLKIAATWPWATAIITAWKPIQALPLPSLVTPLTMAAQTGIGIPRAFPPACSAWS
jgi:hypothetical protein